MKKLQLLRLNALFAVLMASILFFSGNERLRAQGIETFDSLRIPGTAYKDSSFMGNQGIRWTYISARTEGSYPINGRGILLRGSAYGSKIFSDSIQGGIGNFSVKLKKASTSSDSRQVALYINGDSISSVTSFGTTASDTTVHLFSVGNINLLGKFILEIRCLKPGQITIDDVQWTAYSGSSLPVAPTVHTGNFQQITSNSFKIEGNISDEGSSPTVERGFLWETSPGLSFGASNKSASTDVNTPFYITLSNLIEETTYYYQAYAINTTDTGYGETFSFTVPRVIIPDGTFVEDFERLTASGSSYADGNFIGNYNIRWTYANSRVDNPYPINGKGLTFRYSTKSLINNSRIVSDSIDGGIGDFSVKLRKAYSNTGIRQVALYVNGDSIAASQRFGNPSGASDTIYTFSVNGINQSGKFILEIRHITGDSSNRQLTIDDISWTSYSSSGTPELPQYSIIQIKRTNAEGIADSLNVNCWLEGVVQTRNMQDEGILFSLYDGTGWITVNKITSINGFTPRQGDKIRCKGIVDQKNGLLIFNLEKVSILSSGNTIQEDLEAASLDEDTESKRIVVKHLSLLEEESWPARSEIPESGKIVKCKTTDGNIINVRFLRDSNTAKDYPFDQEFEITGIGSQYDTESPFDSGYEIIPSKISDYSRIKELPENIFQYTAYPNPSNGNFTIELDKIRNLSVKIYAVTGREVKQFSLKMKTKFNVGLQEKGIYFLQIEDADTKECLTTKLVVR